MVVIAIKDLCLLSSSSVAVDAAADHHFGCGVGGGLSPSEQHLGVAKLPIPI